LFAEKTAIYGGLEIRDFTKIFSEWTVISVLKTQSANTSTLAPAEGLRPGERGAASAAIILARGGVSPPP